MCLKLIFTGVEVGDVMIGKWIGGCGCDLDAFKNEKQIQITILI